MLACFGFVKKGFKSRDDESLTPPGTIHMETLTNEPVDHQPKHKRRVASIEINTAAAALYRASLSKDGTTSSESGDAQQQSLGLNRERHSANNVPTGQSAPTYIQYNKGRRSLNSVTGTGQPSSLFKQVVVQQAGLSGNGSTSESPNLSPRQSVYAGPGGQIVKTKPAQVVPLPHAAKSPSSSSSASDAYLIAI